MKTNAHIPESSLRKKTLTWCPPYVFALVLLGGLIVIVGYFLLRKRCNLTFGISALTQQKYKTRLIVKSVIALAFLVALPLTSGLNDTMTTILVVLFILSIVAVLVGNSPLAVTKHKKGEFWISGCSKEFLARIPEEADKFVLPATTWPT